MSGEETILRKSIRFRFKPTKEQYRRLYRMAGARRFIYNWALERRKEHYRATGKALSLTDLSTELTDLKSQPQSAWLKEADSQVLQQALADLHKAFVNFFEGRWGFPRFKSKKRGSLTFRYPQRAKVVGSKAVLPGVGRAKIRRKGRHIEGQQKSVTVKRDRQGRWFATVVLDRGPLPEVCAPDPEGVAGIDVGLEHFATISGGPRDGHKIDNPRFFRCARRRLRKAHKSLSRKQRGSAGWHRARKKVAKEHGRVADQRRDFLHQLSARLVGEHDGIAAEDLNLKGLVRTKLARSFADAAHGLFRAMLDYKCRFIGKPFVEVDRFFPSTKLCGRCQTINEDLTLADREWVCKECGTLHDRDDNASSNIRTEGLKIMEADRHEDSINGGGGSVRPTHSGQPPLKPQESHPL